MKRDVLIQKFRETYGFVPCESDLEAFAVDITTILDDEPSYQRPFHQDYSRAAYKTPAEDLWSEIGGICSSIITSAKKSVNVTEKNDINEFQIMAMLFLSKAFIYFLTKNAINNGYEISQI